MATNWNLNIPDDFNFAENSESSSNSNDSFSQNNSDFANSNNRKDSFRFLDSDIPDLVAMSLSVKDVKQILPLIPELKGIVKKTASLNFKEELIPILQKDTISNVVSRFISKIVAHITLLFFTAIIVVFNSQSFKFLWIDPMGWGIPNIILYPSGFVFITLIDFLISELVRDFLMLILANELHQWLDDFQFKDCNAHPLQSQFNKTLQSEFDLFIKPYQRRKLWLLYFLLLFVIIGGEALVSVHLLFLSKENFSLWLSLTPLLSGGLNIVTGIIKGVCFKYPKELKNLKTKLNDSKLNPFY